MSTKTFEYENEDGEEVSVEIPLKWEICGDCKGEGKRMHPAIANHAYTQEEFEHDFSHDERVAYFNGGYDVACDTCDGTGKVKVEDLEKLERDSPDVFKRYQSKLEDDAAFEAENRAERRAECAAACSVVGCWDDFFDGNY